MRRLRAQLQHCQRRQRLSLAALDRYIEFMGTVVLSLPIASAGEILGRVNRIRALLSDEEGQL